MKISGVKRSQHIKHKKNYARPTKKKENQTKSLKSSEKALSTSKKVFGKPTGQKSNKRKEQNAAAVQNEHEHKGKSAKNKFSKGGKPTTTPTNGHSEPENEFNDEDIQDMLDMIDNDDEDLDGQHNGTSKKRKRETKDVADEDEAHQFEQEYAHTRNEEKSKKMRTVDLLPIKTKFGELITRSTEVEIKKKVKQTSDDGDGEGSEAEEDVVDSDDDIINEAPTSEETLAALSNKISTTDLLILREQEINRQKYRIGIICSGILEKPDDKMKNFNSLFELMDERHNDVPNLFSVRKIATLSILEVFKDIIPEYRIGQIDLKTQKGELNFFVSLYLSRKSKIPFCDFSKKGNNGAGYI